MLSVLAFVFCSKSEATRLEYHVSTIPPVVAIQYKDSGRVELKFGPSTMLAGKSINIPSGATINGLKFLTSLVIKGEDPEAIVTDALIKAFGAVPITVTVN